MFDEVKRNFGFGCMRLPMNGEEVNTQEVNRMVDAFIEAGFNYFDTAHGYIDGKSEKAIKTCLTSRYPRDKYVLANKLSDWFFEKEEEVRPLFEQQLEICGVEYFDFYLFHALQRLSYAKHKECNTFEIVNQLHKEGKIRHIAMSFHDTADIWIRFFPNNRKLRWFSCKSTISTMMMPAFKARLAMTQLLSTAEK